MSNRLWFIGEVGARSETREGLLELLEVQCHCIAVCLQLTRTGVQQAVDMSHSFTRLFLFFWSIHIGWPQRSALRQEDEGENKDGSKWFVCKTPRPRRNPNSPGSALTPAAVLQLAL